jgi:hypothetical protein
MLYSMNLAMNDFFPRYELLYYENAQMQLH